MDFFTLGPYLGISGTNDDMRKRERCNCATSAKESDGSEDGGSGQGSAGDENSEYGPETVESVEEVEAEAESIREAGEDVDVRTLRSGKQIARESPDRRSSSSQPRHGDSEDSVSGEYGGRQKSAIAGSDDPLRQYIINTLSTGDSMHASSQGSESEGDENEDEQTTGADVTVSAGPSSDWPLRSMTALQAGASGSTKASAGTTTTSRYSRHSFGNVAGRGTSVASAIRTPNRSAGTR